MATKRRCTSFVVDDSVLFDVGSGTVGGLVENGLDTRHIKIIVISHFHGDHFGDIVYFLHRRSMQGNTDVPLTIIGPLGLQKKVIEFFNFLFGEIRNYSDLANMMNIKFVELEDRKKVIAEDFEIEAFRVVHSTLNANGYIIKSGEKTLGYTGDACISDGLLARIPDAKSWIMEANEIMRKENLHIGFGELIGLADTFKTINFYAVHRNDYDISSNNQINLIVPLDNDEFVVK